MTPYSGNGAYCYANSLYMSLLGAGADARELATPGFLECLTTVPFGNMYLALEDGPLVFFSGANIDPDSGLTRALSALGWICQEQRGGSGAEALAQVREAARKAPVLVGPVDMGYLSYHPGHHYMAGADHFMAVLAVEDDFVLLHDPQGYPCALLPHHEFLQAWEAERVPYRTAPYTYRASFQQVEQVSRQTMIARTLPAARANLEADPGGPVAYGGVRVFAMLAKDLRGEVPDSLVSHLLHFALPLAARRNLDAAAFMREAGIPGAAACLERQARLFGLAQYSGAHGQWASVADVMEQLAEQESALIAAL